MFVEELITYMVWRIQNPSLIEFKYVLLQGDGKNVCGWTAGINIGGVSLHSGSQDGRNGLAKTLRSLLELNQRFLTNLTIALDEMNLRITEIDLLTKKAADRCSLISICKARSTQSGDNVGDNSKVAIRLTNCGSKPDYTHRFLRYNHGWARPKLLGDGDYDCTG